MVEEARGVSPLQGPLSDCFLDICPVPPARLIRAEIAKPTKRHSLENSSVYPTSGS